VAKKLKLAKGKKTEAAAEAPAKAKKAKKEGTRKYAGKTSGLSVTEFQNKLMAANFKAKLTDEKLAAAMRAEFPSAVAYTTGHVVGIRSAWNNGKRSGQDGVAPEKKLPRFNDDGSSTLETRGRGGKKAAKKDKAETAAPAKKGVKKIGKPAPAAEEAEEESEDEAEE
jgi:hypothetical protein